MSYSLEVEMVAEARKLDMLTTPYSFNAEESRQMAKAGADIIVAHMGLTTSGTIGAKTGRTLGECVDAVQEIRDAAVGVNPDILVLCHGGPIAEPGDAKFILERSKGVHGFFGASSVERLPTEKAISGVVKEFAELKISR
jgi:predicted TIM-barrel enzyme